MSIQFIGDCADCTDGLFTMNCSTGLDAREIAGQEPACTTPKPKPSPHGTPAHRRPPMTDTQSLIARLEAATGPDRELDARIWWDFGGGKKHWPHYADMPALDAVARVWGRNPSEPVTFGNTYFAGPKFTASIDAAVTLVPEGWLWRIMPSDFNGWLAEVWTDDTRDGDFGGRAPTPALAICIAALRAKGGE